MGLAASQARLLTLQARQSNLEYQAQQINQERSVLSQQCTAMYNSLLAMTVPTPPSTSDYTKLEYSGSMGATNFSIGLVKPDGEGSYVVEMKQTATGDKLVEDYGTVAVTQDPTTGEYYVGNKKCLSWGDAMEELGNSEQYERALKNAFPDDCDPDNYYVYITTTESGTKEAKFIKKSDVTDKDGHAKTYSYIPNGDFTKSESKKGCLLEFDAQGMITKIGIPNGNGGHDWIELTAAKVTDNNAYNDAMNEYEYAQYLYDQKQQEINAKTEILQQQDRNLELKLQRLENERQEIDAEVEAVEKVIKDNIEGSFKTFSG